jgi:hypothetical protein
VIDDAVAGIIPNMDAEREVGLRLHGTPAELLVRRMLPLAGRDENKARTRAGTDGWAT